MTQVIRAVYEGGILRPLDALKLAERQQVTLTVESPEVRSAPAQEAEDDPLAGLKISTGIDDLAEHFEDYRQGTRQP